MAQFDRVAGVAVSAVTGVVNCELIAELGEPCCPERMSGNPNYNALMQELCVGKGWCGSVINGEPSHVDDLIPDTGPVSADQFVDWLFLAESYEQALEPKVKINRRVLREAFVRYMGSDVVDASELKWDVG